MLALGYGCGLRAGEIVRLRAGDIDSAQMIIRIVQSKGRKDRHVMLPHGGARQHIARCENDACGHTVIAYSSCRNRHCPGDIDRLKELLGLAMEVQS
jgi:integrase